MYEVLNWRVFVVIISERLRGDYSPQLKSAVFDSELRLNDNHVTIVFT